jgi:hypothetical protein
MKEIDAETDVADKRSDAPLDDRRYARAVKLVMPQQPRAFLRDSSVRASSCPTPAPVRLI